MTANGQRPSPSDELQRRDALLSGVAEAARQLVVTPDFSAAVNGALEAIATAAGIDRIFIYQNHIEPDTRRDFATCPYEWTVPNVVKGREIPGQYPMFYDEIDGFVDWLDELKAGRPVQKLAQEMSKAGQAKQEQEQALSVLTVPIFIQGSYWGNFGLDDCTTARVWSEAEIAVLETAAASFAGALERRDNVAELERRDALLNSVNEAAQCLVATDDLEQAISEALRILGEGTQQDRVYVFENVFPKGPDEVFWEIPYEWVKTGVPTSTEVTTAEWPIAMASFPQEVRNLKPFWDRQAIQFLTRNLDGEAKQINEEGQTLSLIAVPITISGQWWGVLGFDDCTTERVWSEAEIAVLETAATCLGSAIERDRNQKHKEATAQARAEELSQVNSILQTSLTSLASQTDLNAFLGHVTHLINQAAGAFSGHVFLLDAPTNTLELRLSVKKGQIHIGASATEPELFQHPFPADITPAYPDLCTTREIGLYGGYLDTDSDLMWPGTTEWHRRSGHIEAAAVALFAGDLPIGMLGLTFAHEVDLSDEDRDLIRALADQAALAIQLANLAEETKQTALLQEREQAAQARGAELAKVNHVLKETIDTLVAEPELSRFLGSVLKAIAQQFNSPFLEYWSNWRTDEENTAYLEQVVINGEVLTGEQLSGHHGINGLSIPPELIKADDLSQRTQYIEIDISPNNPFIEPFYDSIYSWCRDRSVDLAGRAINFPIILGHQSLGAIAIFLPKERELSKETINLGYALANQVALAMQLTQLAEEAKQTALLQERETVAKARIAELAKRDRILEATAAAANVMLTVDDFDRAINTALQIVGEGLEVDRVNLGEHFEAISQQESGYHHFLYEWNTPKTPRQIEFPEFERVSDSGMEFAIDALQRGEAFGGIVDELPEPFRSAQLELGVVSTYAIPIHVDSNFWGIIACDDCHRLTRRSEGELEALKTLANCIGNAIERDRIRQEREAAALARAAELESHNLVLAMRDRILEATAAAANVMLTANDFDSSINTALQIVGEGLGVDRVALGENFDTVSAQEVGYFQFLYEWASPGTFFQTEHPDLARISHSGMEYFFDVLRNGDPCGGIVDEFPEPFRSTQLELGVQSTYAVPIHVNDHFWGIIGFDDCHRLLRRSEGELEALKTLANCIGNAIERDHTRKEREAAALNRAAELEAYNRALRERDRILEATAAISNVLLTDEDFDAALNEAMKIIGEAVGTDRVGIAENIADLTDTTPGQWLVIGEWTAPGITPVAQIHSPEPMQGTYAGAEQLYALHQRGDGFSLLTEQMKDPFRSSMAFVGVQTLHSVPIILRGSYWGTIVLGDCRQQRLRSSAELAALQTVADSIGNAIERERLRQTELRIRQEREAAERAILIERERAARAEELEKANQVLTVRDRWLETTAIVAQQLLSSDNVESSISEALKTVGENLECDRVYVMQHQTTPDDSPSDLGFARMTYEWAADDMAPHIDIPSLRDLPGESFKDLFEQLLAGQWVGGVVDELDEPLRSRQRSLGIKSFYTVPVFIEGKPWGVVGLGHCRKVKRLNSAELAVFKTAATCIGSTIYQAEIRRDQATQERAKLLSSVADAANLLLRSTDYKAVLPEVVRILGEAVECDRCGIGQNILHPVTGEPAVDVKPEWEWRTPSTLPAASFSPHGDLLYSWDDGPFLTEQMRKGVAASYLVADLPERDRHLMAVQGTTATLFFPIMLEHRLWGFIHFDSNSHNPRLYGQAEISILKVAAESITAAISRQVQDEALRRSGQAILEEREQVAQARATELETFNQQLQKRDGLLNSVNAAAQCLVANEDLSVALPAMLQILGEGTKQCRAYILQNSRDAQTDELIFNLTLEWDAPGIPTKREAGGRFPVPVNTFPDHLTAPLKAGRSTQFLARELDGLDQRDQGQALSLVGVPISVEGEWWGLLGLDDCINERIWSEAEIAVLETAATSIGNALERDLTRKAREAAEQAVLLERERAARAAELEVANQVLLTRERWLDATAAAANKLLSSVDVAASVNAALKTIGVSLGCDRIGIMKHFPELTGLGTFRILYEWDSPGTRPQIADPSANEMPASDFEEWSKQLIAGNWVGGIVAELNDDPFRSEMEALDTLSTYAVPIFVEAEFWGFMFMDHCQELRQLSPAELAVFNTAATCIGSAIYRDQMRAEREQAERETLLQKEREQAAQQRVAELAKANESLNQTIGALAENPELEEFLGSLLAELAQQTGACKTHLYLYDSETHTLRQHSAVQEGQTYLGAAPTDPDMFRKPIPADLTDAWRAILDSPRPLTVNELGSPTTNEQDLWWPETIPWHRREGHREVACARMKAGDQPIGYIGFAFRECANLTDGQLELIQALTNQATLAIQLTRLAEQNQTAALVDERNRLAREIHDTLAQTFTGVSIQLEAVRGITTPQPGVEPTLQDFQAAQAYIRRARDLARAGLSEARRSVQSLRSAALETESLPIALRKTLAQTTRDTGLDTHFYLEGDPIPLPDDIQLNLLRIGQEAITNTLRYAQATQLDLTLSFTADPHKQVQLRIVDNGQGFDATQLAEKSGFGLLGIRERTARFYGTFELLSTPGIGTTLDIVIPLSP